MEDRNETFPEKTYKHFITSGILRLPVSNMEMIRQRLKNGAEKNSRDEPEDSPRKD